MLLLYISFVTSFFESNNIPKFSYIYIQDGVSDERIEKLKEEYDKKFKQYQQCNYDEEKEKCKEKGDDCGYIDEQINFCKAVWNKYQGLIMSNGKDISTKLSQTPSNTRFLFFVGHTDEIIDFNHLPKRMAVLQMPHLENNLRILDSKISGKDLAQKVSNFHKKLSNISFDGSSSSITKLVKKLDQKQIKSIYEYDILNIVGPMKSKVSSLTITTFQIKFVDGACDCESLSFIGTDCFLYRDSKSVKSDFVYGGQLVPSIQYEDSKVWPKQAGTICDKHNIDSMTIGFTKLQMTVKYSDRDPYYNKVFSYKQCETFNIVITKDILSDFTEKTLNIDIYRHDYNVEAIRNINFTFGPNNIMTKSVLDILEASKVKVNISFKGEIGWENDEIKPKIFLTYDKNDVDIQHHVDPHFIVEEHKLATFENDDDSNKFFTTPVIIGIAVGGAVVLVIIIVLIVYFAVIRKRKQKVASAGEGEP